MLREIKDGNYVMFVFHVITEKDYLFPGTKLHLIRRCIFTALHCVSTVKHLRLKLPTAVQSNLVGDQY